MRSHSSEGLREGAVHAEQEQGLVSVEGAVGGQPQPTGGSGTARELPETSSPQNPNGRAASKRAYRPPGYRALTLRERIDFFTMPVTESGCIVWMGAITGSGYALIWVDGKRVCAHRANYELEVGPIPDGLELDHLCRVRSCVNPHHLEPVTRQENQRRGMGPSGINARKEVCIRGHELSGDNVYVFKTNGSRHCKTCRNVSQRQHYEKNRAAYIARAKENNARVRAERRAARLAEVSP